MRVDELMHLELGFTLLSNANDNLGKILTSVVLMHKLKAKDMKHQDIKHKVVKQQNA